MKKVIKMFLFSLLVFPLAFVASGCNTSESSSVISIEKTASSGLVDTYTITYENGKTYSFTVTNGSNGTDGEDGENYNINDIYEKAQQAGFTGDFLDFLNTYLKYDEDGETVSTNKALLSAVSVYSNFTGTQTYIYMGKIYTQEVEYSSAGSGVIYRLDKQNGDAYIITNYHVIYDTDSNQTNGISEDISIYLYGYQNEESKIDATFFGGSAEKDLAVLKIENSEILKNSSARECDVRDSEKINVGETAIAVGNPEAMGIAATSGIVSVDSEYISMTSLDGKSENTHRVIRIDTAVNGGNSGGGLFDKDGNLIGIVNAKITDSSIENIAFAIPSNVATSLTQNIIDNGGTLKKLTFGITLDEKNAKSVYNSETQMVDIVEDVVIESIEQQSLAQQLELQSNDKILKIKINGDEISITRTHQIIDFTYLAKVNDVITLTIERQGSQAQVTFTAKQEFFK